MKLRYFWAVPPALHLHGWTALPPDYPCLKAQAEKLIAEGSFAKAGKPGVHRSDLIRQGMGWPRHLGGAAGYAERAPGGIVWKTGLLGDPKSRYSAFT